MTLSSSVTDTKQSCIHYYDERHAAYLNDFSDELERKPYDRNFLNRFTNLLAPASRVLDVGCSSAAQQARFLHDKGFRVTSIDLSGACISTAKHHFKGIEFLQMDMTQMSFCDEAFSAIVAFYSIIHITNEQLPVLFDHLNRVLQPGGKLALSVHAGDFYGYYQENEIPVFYRTFSQEELLYLLSQSGFQLLEMDQRPPLYDFEFPSERIYVLAEKP